MRRTIRLAGLVVVLIALGISGIAWWNVFGTNYSQHRSQTTLRKELKQEQTPAVATPRAHAPARPVAPVESAPAPGHALAELRAPRLGAGWSQVIVEGTTTADLKRGPGHIEGTALPGGVGNFGVSGHRTTYGKPFSNIDLFRVGDPIFVTTTHARYVYLVTGSETVLPTNVSVVASTPGSTAHMLTFTTCTPRYSASHRLVVHARMVTE